MQGSNSIKAVQLGVIIFVTQTGVGTIMLPSALAKEAGHDGWLSVLVTAGIVAVLSLLIYFLVKRYSDKAIYEINRFLFGKVVGTSFNVILVLYLFATTAAGASLFNYFIRITLLQQTPAWVLAPYVTLPSVYLVWHGLKAMSRFLYVSLTGYAAITVFFFLMMTNMRGSFLLPIGEAGISAIIRSIPVSFFAFIGFELLAFFNPYIMDRNKTLRWYMIATAASTLFFILLVVVSTGVFGANLLRVISLPFYYLARVYNAPILERVDLYIIALWFIPMGCSMRNYIFATFDGLQKVFHLKKTKITYTLFFLVVWVLSAIPKDFNDVLRLIELINYLGMAVSVYLVACLIFSLFRKKGVLNT